MDVKLPENLYDKETANIVMNTFCGISEPDENGDFKYLYTSSEDNMEELSLSDEELEYVKSIVGDENVQDPNGDRIYIIDLTHIKSTTDLVKVLFAYKKYEDAWKIMALEVDDIDYIDISNSKYFVVSTMAGEVYKKLYDRGILTDEQYAYHDLICVDPDMKNNGMNIEFWKCLIKKSNCQNFTDICELVSKSYNGVSFESVPFSMMKDEWLELMKTYLMPTDKLDKYVYDEPAFIFPVDVLFNLIEGGHFDDVSRILSIIISVSTEAEKASSWNRIMEIGTRVTDYKSFFKSQIIANEEILFSLFDYSNTVLGNNNPYLFEEEINSRIRFLTAMLVNSSITPKYISTVLIKLKELQFENTRISYYLAPKFIQLAILFKDAGITSGIGFDYEFLRGSDNKYLAVYDRANGYISIANYVYASADVVSKETWDDFLEDPNYEDHNMEQLERELLNKVCGGDNIAFKELMLELSTMIKYNNDLRSLLADYPDLGDMI